jgi:PAS domain S-box-containing protein
MTRPIAEGIDDASMASDSMPLVGGAVGIAHLDTDGTIIKCNHCFAEMLGYQPQDIAGRSLHAFTARADLEEYARLNQEMRDGKRRTFQINKQYIHRDGSTVWAILTVGGVRKPDGSLDRFVAIINDITEKHQAAEALADSEERFRATFENAAVGMAHVAPDGSWLRVNQRVCDILGYTPEELLLITFQDITHPDDLDIDLGLLQETLEGKRDKYCINKRYYRKGGELVWAKLTVGCVRKPDGQVDYFISVIENITGEVRKDEALRQSEEQFRATFENAAIGMAQVAPDGTWLRMNQRVCEFLGYTEEELLQRTFQSMTYPEDLPLGLEQMQEMFAGKRRSMQIEKRYIRKDGEIVWANLSVACVRNPEGEVEYMISVIEDITEKRRMRRALTQSEVRFQAVQQTMPDGFMIFRSLRNERGEIEDFVCEYGNPAASQLLSIDPQDMPGHRMLVRNSLNVDVGLFDIYCDVVAAGRTAQGELEFPFQDSTSKWFRYSAVKVDDGFAVAFTDISRAKDSEARLRESEARLRAFHQTTPDGFVIFRSLRDPQGGIADFQILYANPAAGRLSNFDADRLPETTMLKEAPLLPDLGVFARFVEVVETGTPWQGEFFYPLGTADGAWYGITAAKVDDGIAVSYADISAQKEADEKLRAQEERSRAILNSVISFVTLLTPDGIVLEINESALATANLTASDVVGKHFWDTYWWSHDADEREELRRSVAKAANGERVLHDATVRVAGDGRMVVANMLAPVVDEQGNVIHVVASGFDISDRKRAEQHREMLVKELSHRVKNSLATVQTIASHTLREAADLESFREAFVGRLMAISKCHDLLIDTTRRDADISQLVRDQVLPYARVGLDGQVKMSGPPLIMGPEAAHTFGLILHELATNAAKYGALSTEQGRLDISWKRGPDPSVPEAILTWVETGGPPVQPPARRGFGSVLIEQSLSHALGGQAKIEYRPEGLWAQFRFRKRGE